ncbi:MAG: hypothetical protein WD601_14230 [Pseudohongiellaceae bacterium]
MTKYCFQLVILLILLPSVASAELEYPALEARELAWIGDQIFRNECNRDHACLTAWNPGEDFPSLGIGHFIWYQQAQQERFTESFPALLTYLQNNGVILPPWLATTHHDSPWPDRPTFMAEFDSPRTQSLREMLAETVDLQTAFIISRFENALGQIKTAQTVDGNAQFEQKFMAVANASAPHGLYALIDYVNFKGEGVNTDERYQNQGWGLAQVLAGMPAQSQQPLQDFVTSAKQVLRTRVDNAPPDRDENRWLAGWYKRLDTYLPRD